MYQLNEWTNFGDVSPEHGQLWIKDATVDSDQDFAECVEVHAGRDVGLAENQYMVRRGSIYMPIDDRKKVESALDVIGCTPSLATWIDKALAFHAYHGVDMDTFGGFEIVQVGKTIDDLNASGTTCDDPDVILHGNASIGKYLADNALA